MELVSALFICIEHDDEIVLTGDRPVNVRFDQYRNLASAATLEELVSSEETTVSIDARVSGVGGTPVKPTKEHRVEPESLSFTLTLQPYDLNEYSPEVLGRIRGD